MHIDNNNVFGFYLKWIHQGGVTVTDLRKHHSTLELDCHDRILKNFNRTICLMEMYFPNMLKVNIQWSPYVWDHIKSVSKNLIYPWK